MYMISDPQNVGRDFSLTAVIQPILFCNKKQLCLLQTSLVLVELLDVASDLISLSPRRLPLQSANFN